MRNLALAKQENITGAFATDTCLTSVSQFCTREALIPATKYVNASRKKRYVLVRTTLSH